MYGYCAIHVEHIPGPVDKLDFAGIMKSPFENNKGDNIGSDTQSAWLKPSPGGFYHLLNLISNHHGKPQSYITDNGTSIKGEDDLAVDELLDDEYRTNYFRSYIKALVEISNID